MLIRQTKFSIPLRRYYFTPAAHARFLDYLLPTVFLDCAHQARTYWLIEQKTLTLVTDLQLPEKERFQQLRSNTRNEIRKGLANDELNYQAALNPEKFMLLYNPFATHRGLSQIRKEHFQQWGEHNYCIHGISTGSNSKLLAAHLYLLSHSLNRVQLLLSANLSYRESALAKLTGQANRTLHWLSMCQFAEEGYYSYDWGGYSAAPAGSKLSGIDQFKKAFGGTLKPRYSYYSPAYWLIERCRGLTRHLKLPGPAAK